MISDAADEAEDGPERREVLGRRVGVLLVHEAGCPAEQAAPARRMQIQHHGLEPVAQELDELDKFHDRTAWTKLMKKPG